MKLCTISDTHGQHSKLDLKNYPADVLVFAGDWTKGKDLALSETQDFLLWLNDQPYEHILFIAGNHEVQVEAAPERFAHMLSHYPKLTYLNNSATTIDGVKFYGSPYSNEFYNWAFMAKELDLAPIWAAIPDDTNVLITHGPAYECLDRVNSNHNRDPHVGSTYLRDRKKELQQLKLHVFGHIHESAGSSITTCNNVNASLLNARYQLVNTPIVVNI